MALIKLGKTSLPGVFRWKIELYTKQKRIHRHVELTEVAAQKMYAELLEQRARMNTSLRQSGTGTGFNRRTLAEAVQRYEHELLISGKNTQHVTGVVYSLRILRDLLGDGYPVDAIDRECVRRWREKRSITARVYDKAGKTKKLPTARTINKGLAHLSAFFEFCSGEQWIQNNPVVKALRIKEIKPALRVLGWLAFCRLADEAWKLRPDFGLLIEVLGETGARVDEAFRAKVGDVSAQKRSWMKHVKPGREVELEAEEWVLYAAKAPKPTRYDKDGNVVQLKAEDRPLCPTREGTHFTYTIFKNLFAQAVRNAGLQRMTPHYIRHGRACWELLEGKSVYAVKTKLAHASVTTTERYLRAVDLLRREEAPGTLHRRALNVCNGCVIGGVYPTPPQTTTTHHVGPRKSRKPSKVNEFDVSPYEKGS